MSRHNLDLIQRLANEARGLDLEDLGLLQSIIRAQLKVKAEPGLKLAEAKEEKVEWKDQLLTLSAEVVNVLNAYDYPEHVVLETYAKMIRTFSESITDFLAVQKIPQKLRIGLKMTFIDRSKDLEGHEDAPV